MSSKSPGFLLDLRDTFFEAKLAKPKMVSPFIRGVRRLSAAKSNELIANERNLVDLTLEIPVLRVSLYSFKFLLFNFNELTLGIADIFEEISNPKSMLFGFLLVIVNDFVARQSNPETNRRFFRDASINPKEDIVNIFLDFKDIFGYLSNEEVVELFQEHEREVFMGSLEETKGTRLKQRENSQKIKGAIEKHKRKFDFDLSKKKHNGVSEWWEIQGMMKTVIIPFFGFSALVFVPLCLFWKRFGRIHVKSPHKID